MRGRRSSGALRRAGRIGLRSDASASFRDGPMDQTRNLEIPGSRFARPGMTTGNWHPTTSCINSGHEPQHLGQLGPICYPATAAFDRHT
jgi:hypothetical protein